MFRKLATLSVKDPERKWKESWRNISLATGSDLDSLANSAESAQCLGTLIVNLLDGKTSSESLGIHIMGDLDLSHSTSATQTLKFYGHIKVTRESNFE